MADFVCEKCVFFKHPKQRSTMILMIILIIETIDRLSRSLQFDVQYTMIIEYSKIYRMLCMQWYGPFVCREFLYNHCKAWYLQYAGKYAWPSPDIWNITAAGIAVAILQ